MGDALWTVSPIAWLLCASRHSNDCCRQEAVSIHVRNVMGRWVSRRFYTLRVPPPSLPLRVAERLALYDARLTIACPFSAHKSHNPQLISRPLSVHNRARSSVALSPQSINTHPRLVKLASAARTHDWLASSRRPASWGQHPGSANSSTRNR